MNDLKNDLFWTRVRLPPPPPFNLLKIKMNEKLDKKLVDNFPLLYSDRHSPMQSTCMCWGFECGDGWFDIIWDLSSRLEPLIKKIMTEEPLLLPPKASQVKEKYGSLRFYMTRGSDEIFHLIERAEELSSKTCEECGDYGEERGGGWIRTLCLKCYQNWEEICRKRWETKE